jgi:activator of HSP90 ATPase
MTAKNNPAQAMTAFGRRQVILGSAIVLGGAVLSAKGRAADAAAPAAESDKLRTSLHQEVALNATAQRVYDVLLDSKLFAAFSGEAAEISPQAGGTFSMFGARIEGRNIELVPGTRVVQAWRPAHWDAGIYSIAKFVFAETSGKTKVVLDHTGFPVGDFASLSSGWREHYWQRLEKYFG